MELGIFLANPLGDISIPQLLIDAGTLIIALVGFAFAMREANNKRFDSKADVSRVVKIEEDMDCVKDKKADTTYVDRQISGIHHRITENEAHTLTTLQHIEDNQGNMLEHIMQILKDMPKK